MIRPEINHIITTEDQVVVENAVIEICFTLRFCTWIAPNTSEFLKVRFGGTPVVVDKSNQGM